MRLGDVVRDLAGLRGVVLAIQYADHEPSKVHVRWTPGDHTTWIKARFVEVVRLN